jgi:hypothetical protein
MFHERIKLLVDLLISEVARSNPTGVMNVSITLPIIYVSLIAWTLLR